MRNTISNYFNNKRAERLAKLNIEFDKDFSKYIRPRKKDNEIIGYVIRINRTRCGEIENKDMTPEEKYSILYNSLEKAYMIQQEQKKIENDSDNKKIKKKVKVKGKKLFDNKE